MRPGRTAEVRYRFDYNIEPLARGDTWRPIWQLPARRLSEIRSGSEPQGKVSQPDRERSITAISQETRRFGDIRMCLRNVPPLLGQVNNFCGDFKYLFQKADQ